MVVNPVENVMDVFTDVDTAACVAVISLVASLASEVTISTSFVEMVIIGCFVDIAVVPSCLFVVSVSFVESVSDVVSSCVTLAVVDSGFNQLI